MKRLACEITIGNKTDGFYTFKEAHSISLNSSREELTDTCAIQVQKKAKHKGKSISIGKDRLFKRGDEVSVKFGYWPTLQERFSGYVKEVISGDVVTIECEDQAFLLKQKSITESFENVTLDQLLDKIVPAGLSYEAPTNSNLGKLRISKVTAAQVLKKLESKYKLRSFIKDKRLYVGLRYVDISDDDPVRFKVGFNVAERNDLIWRNRDDITVKIKATSILSDNTKIESETAGEGDVVFDFSYFGLNQEALDKRVNEELEEQSFDGFRGKFTAKGEPYVTHSSKVSFEDPAEGHSGQYYVKSVETTFDTSSGINQIIELDRKA